MQVTQVGRVLVPVRDQDEAIAFYTEKLGFEVVVDAPFGDGDRWVEVGPPQGGTSLALVPPRGEYQPGRMTGIALDSPDPSAVHEELQSSGVDVDAELLGGDGTVPQMFFFRDHDGNQLLFVEAQSG